MAKMAMAMATPDRQSTMRELQVIQQSPILSEEK
jgi:hypothetical protein